MNTLKKLLLLAVMFFMATIANAQTVYHMNVVGHDTLYACGDTICDPIGNDDEHPMGAHSWLILYPEDSTKVFFVSGTVNLGGTYDWMLIKDLVTGETMTDLRSNPNQQTIEPFTTYGGIEIHFYSDWYFSDDSFRVVTTCIDFPTCLPVRNLHAVHLNVDSIVVAWTDTINGGVEYLVEYSLADSNNWNSFSVYDTIAAIGNLDTNTAYDIKVRAVCSPGDTSLVRGKVTLSTLAKAPIEVPFNCTFEIDSVNANWTLDNGNNTNAWYIGSVVSNGGDSAMYISCDGGVTNTYNVNATSKVNAFVTFRLPAGEYDYRFDWRANGYGDYDKLSAFLVPINQYMTVYTEDHWPYYLNNVSFDGGGLSENSSWTTREGVVIIPGGTYQLFFEWKNSAYWGSQPPAAVDNVYFAPVSCPRPSDMTFVTDSNAITVSWTSNGNESAWIVSNGITTAVATDTFYTFQNLTPATNYYFSVAAYCGVGDTSISIEGFTHTECATYSLPFYESFENYIDLGHHRYAIPCWEVLNLDGDDFFWSMSENNPHSGNYCAQNCAYTGQTPHDWIITPELFLPVNTSGYYVEWYAMAPVDTSHLTVVIITTDGNGSTVYDTIFFAGLPSTWHEYYYDISQYMGQTIRVAFINDEYAVNTYLDDVTVRAIPTCFPPTVVTATCGSHDLQLSWNHDGTESAWEVSNGITAVVVTDTFYTFQNLNPGTNYTITIRSICSPGDTSDSYSVTFTTADVQSVATLPYFCDFTSPEGQEWGLQNGSFTNGWRVGTAAHNSTADNYGLYISNDNGVSNEYTTTAYAHVFAYRYITLPAGDYTYSFDWRAFGDNYFNFDSSLAAYDYMRAALCPADLSLTMWNSPYHLPSGVIPLDGDHALFYDSSWTTQSGEFIIDNAGDYKIVFYWVNNNTNGIQPPAAVDNVSLVRKPCSGVSNLAAVASGLDRVVVDWDSDPSASAWQVEFGPMNFALGSGTVFTAYSHPVNISNLERLTAYDVWVRPLCGDGDTGSWRNITVKTSFCDITERVAIGDSAYGLGVSYLMPIVTLYNYSLCQFIVDSTEIGGPTDIDAIELNYNGPQMLEGKNDIDIYIQPTSKSVFADPDDAEPLDSTIAVHVFHGSFEDFTIGWNTVEFDNTYHYSGNGNLMLIFKDNSGSYNYGRSFITMYCDGNKCLYYYDDYYNPNIYDPSSLERHKYIYNERPMMNFVRCGVDTTTADSTQCLAPEDLLVTATGLNSVTFDWTPNEWDTAWRIYVWNTGTEPLAFDADSHPATVNGLPQFTAYNAAVVTVCDDTTLSNPSNIVTFTTNECQPVSDAAVGNITPTSATISWSSDAASYTVEYGYGDFEQGHGNVVDDITTTSYTITGLIPNRNYSAYVRANCDADNPSAWSQRLTFRTATNAIVELGEAKVIVYPNPTSDNVTIAIGGVSGEVTVTIVDLTGRTWYADSLVCDGDCVSTVDVAGLAEGVYFVRLSGESVNMVKKLVVK